jgi:hypothetical protein
LSKETKQTEEPAVVKIAAVPRLEVTAVAAVPALKLLHETAAPKGCHLVVIALAVVMMGAAMATVRSVAASTKRAQPKAVGKAAERAMLRSVFARVKNSAVAIVEVAVTARNAAVAGEALATAVVVIVQKDGSVSISGHPGLADTPTTMTTIVVTPHLIEGACPQVMEKLTARATSVIFALGKGAIYGQVVMLCSWYPVTPRQNSLSLDLLDALGGDRVCSTSHFRGRPGKDAGASANRRGP